MEVLWKKCLDEMEMKVLPESFTTWLTPTYPDSLEGDELTIIVPNKFFEKCIKENYMDLIRETLESIVNKKLTVNLKVKNGDRSKEKKSLENSDHNSIQLNEKPPINTNNFLNTRYTFSNFVVGSSNQFAHAACQAITNNPAHNYNPLFLYGAVGLGKTHLLHAIGNAMLEKHPGLQVRYISAESFTVDLIESIRKNQMPAFRERYRPMDVLLVDDIQFLAGKDRTQEEFFYTFNSLYDKQKQIVLSSDRYPKDMHNIEERLRSRFDSGLIGDIMPPDLETKIAILYKKADVHQKQIPHDVAQYLANNIKSNVRELEGLLLRVIAFASFTKCEINLELAKEVLKEFTVDQNRNFTVHNILKASAGHFGIKVSDIKSKRRTRDISIPRQIAMYICREYTKNSLPSIGEQFGGKDHTSVIFSHRKISSKINEDKELKRHVEQVVKKVQSM
ncbi:MAG: chromosomal replication initiator protein DnaA [Nitrospinales bacterium]